MLAGKEGKCNSLPAILITMLNPSCPFRQVPPALSLPPKNQRFCCLMGIANTVEGPWVPAFLQCGFFSEHGVTSAVLAGELWTISSRWCGWLAFSVSEWLYFGSQTKTLILAIFPPPPSKRWLTEIIAVSALQALLLYCTEKQKPQTKLPWNENCFY